MRNDDLNVYCSKGALDKSEFYLDYFDLSHLNI